MPAIVVERDKPIVIRRWAMLNILDGHECLEFTLAVVSLLDAPFDQCKHIGCDGIGFDLMFGDTGCGTYRAAEGPARWQIVDTRRGKNQRFPCCPVPRGSLSAIISCASIKIRVRSFMMISPSISFVSDQTRHTAIPGISRSCDH